MNYSRVAVSSPFLSQRQEILHPDPLSTSCYSSATWFKSTTTSSHDLRYSLNRNLQLYTMERYDKWTELQLQKESTRRYLDNDGQKVELTRRLVDDDKSKHEPRGTFSKFSDPTGKYEEAYIRSQTKFEKNSWYSILGSEIQFHEDMIKAKKAQLFEALKKADKELKAAMQVKEARIAGYKGVKEVASPAVTGAKSTGAQRTGTSDVIGVKPKRDFNQKTIDTGGGSQDDRT